MTKDELKALVREAVREELSHAGLLLEDEQHVFLARDDFRFLRRFRLAVDGAASSVGKSVMAAVTAAALGAIWLAYKLTMRN